MKRTVLAIFLVFGVVGGLASGFHGLHHYHHDRAAFERHVAELCVDAAARNLQHARK